MSSEDFKSFIVTNPDLVDEGIDISGLNTTTDTSPFLLGNIPGGPGLQYSSIDPTRYSDLIRFYSQGLPMLDTPQAVAPVVDTTPVVDTSGGGGMDQATGGLDTGNAPINVDTPLTQMVTTPTGDTMTVKEAMTSDDAYSLDTPSFDDQFQEIEDIPITSNLDNIDLGNPTDDPRVQPEEFSLVPDPEYTDQIMDPNLMDIRQQQAIDFAPEQRNAINDAFNSVKDLGVAGVNNFKDSLIALGGKVREGFDNTIEIGGKTIDLTKSLKSGVISLVGKALTGVPGLGLVASLLPKGGRSEMANKLGEQYGMDDIGRLTGGPMAGYAVDSGFGKGIEQATQNRINDIRNRPTQTEAGLKEIEGLIGFLEQIERNKTAIDYDMEGTDEGDRAAEEAAAAQAEADRIEAERRALQEINAAAARDRRDDSPAPSAPSNPYSGGEGGVQSGMDTPSSNDGGFGNTEGPRGGDPYGGGEGGVQSGLDSPDVGAPTGISGPPSRGGTATTGPSGPPSQGGGGGGGKGIVCTMMNDFYGFGSFRNKIWLEHSKSLAPEYQKGYHKIFLPLVAYARKDGVTNKIVRKTLEHIAVHRTIDIRQEARGKTHLLGRVYRKILEPICYLVGKYAK